MSLLGRLALLFVIVPLIELVLLVQLGQWVGLPLTLGLVVLTGALGAVLARAEGLRVLWTFQRELTAGRLPGQALQDAVAVLVGGAFLLTPGILTDVAGFALLLPPTRRWIQGRARRSLERGLQDGSVRFVVGTPGGTWPPDWTRAGGSGDQGAGGTEAERGSGLDPAKEIRVDPPNT